MDENILISPADGFPEMLSFQDVIFVSSSVLFTATYQLMILLVVETFFSFYFIQHVCSVFIILS